MTVKELKERLDKFHENCIIVVPNSSYIPGAKGSFEYAVAQNVTQGCNEFDGLVFIDDYVEEYDDEV